MFEFCENRILFLEVPDSGVFEHQQLPQIDGKEALKLQREKHRYEFEDAKVDHMYGLIEKILETTKVKPKTVIVLSGVVGNAPLVPMLDSKLIQDVRANLTDILRFEFVKEVLGDSYDSFENACYTDGLERALESLDIAKRQAVMKYAVAYLCSKDLKEKLEKKFQGRLGIVFEIAEPKWNQDEDVAVCTSVKLKMGDDEWWNQRGRFEQAKNPLSVASLFALEARRSDVLINEFAKKYEFPNLSRDVDGTDKDYVADVLKNMKVWGIAFGYFLGNGKKLRRKYGGRRFSELHESFAVRVQSVLVERRMDLLVMKNDPCFYDFALGASRESDKDLAKINEQLKRIDKAMDLFWEQFKQGLSIE